MERRNLKGLRQHYQLDQYMHILKGKEEEWVRNLIQRNKCQKLFKSEEGNDSQIQEAQRIPKKQVKQRHLHWEYCNQVVKSQRQNSESSREKQFVMSMGR